MRPPAVVSWLRRVQLGIAMVALAVMMLVTVADVAMRYAFRAPIRGAYDLTETCLAVFVFNGIAMTFAGRRNVVIDLIDGMISRRAVGVLVRVADLLSVGCLMVLGWAMVAPALQAAAYGDAQPELGLPLIYLWAVAIVGLAGAVVSALGTAMTAHRPHEGPPVV